MERNPNVEYSGRKPNPLRGLVLLLAALVTVAIFSQVKPWLFGEQSPGAEARAVTPRGDLTPEETDTIALFKRVSPSVVFITNIAVRHNPFSLNAVAIPQGTGSGFIWDANGYVVTNVHVIENAQAAEVTLADHSTWKAQLVGYEPDKDLAVLKIDAPKELLTPIAVGTSSDLEVGQKVLAIGNPFGFDQTLTTGVISGLGREIESMTRRPIQGVIQTDAAINPGNSGGPLLDSAGRLIGINTAIFSPSGAYAGIGFAVPVDVVNRMVPQIIRYGRVRKASLGITIADDQIVRRLGAEGVLVVEVIEAGAASKAGIRATRVDARGRILSFGDFIIGVDGKPVRSSKELYLLLDSHEIGDTVKLRLRRPDGEVDVDVTLQDVS